NVVRIQRPKEAPLPRQNAGADEIQHRAQWLWPGGTSTFGAQRRASRTEQGEVEADVAAVEPGLQPVRQRIRPALGRILNHKEVGAAAALAADAWEVLDVLALDGEADATTAHRDHQRFAERLDALDGLVGAVV